MKKIPLTLSPPRLLIGVALLYWGAVSGHPLVGLLCAFLVEARAWVEWRWNFGERGFVRAWALSMFLGVLVLLWTWLQGESTILLFGVLKWMPVFLLPLILAQRYAIRESMPINTFSFIARRKMQLDRAAGRPVEPMQIHLGYLYFSLVLVAAGFSGTQPVFYIVALVILAALALFFASPLSRLRPVSWAAALVLVVFLGLGVGTGILAIDSLLGGIYFGGGLHTSPDRIRTAIGQLGRIKQSYKVLWRIDDPEPAGPRLFREAAYNRYGAGHWTHRPMVGSRPVEDYDDMDRRVQNDTENQFAFDPNEFGMEPQARRKLTARGSVRRLTPLPLPDSMQRLSKLKAQFVEFNSLGTVRLENPEHTVVEFDVYYGGKPLYERGPDAAWDMQVPEEERPGIARVATEWGLHGWEAREVMAKIHARFLHGFRYTMHLGQHYHIGPRYSEAVSTFLEADKPEGHCEYFATAAVLLLREAGIPARYCVGFSAQEKGKDGEWLLRGRHGHAWCRVYVGGEKVHEYDPQAPEGEELRTVWTGGKWIDFDPTPPNWFAVEGSGVPWDRRMLDWWQGVREDFLVWRTTEGNSGVVNWVMGILGALLLGYVSVRLAMSRTRRRRRGAVRGSRGREGAVVTPLHGLRKVAEPWLGPRGNGEAFTAWILGLGRVLPVTESNLQRAVTYHWKARFDPIGLDPSEVDEFEALCQTLKARLKELRKAGSPSDRHDDLSSQD